MATDYGRDLWCVEDLNPAMVEVTGNLNLAQACARRLITPRGTLIDDPNYGTDVRDWINDDVTQQQIATLQSAIVRELLKDERVLDVQVTVRFLTAGTLDIVIVLTGGNGPFQLVLSVDAVTVTLLQPVR
jgi:phage baseplate assembly protein W